MLKKKKNSLCLGSANFGFNYGINKKEAINKKDLKRLLNYAAKNNISFIDTAIIIRILKKK